MHLKRLKREDFFGNPKIQKLTSQINKKTKSGETHLIIKEVTLINFLQENSDWLDYVGISMKYKKEKKTLMIRWESL